LCFAKNINRPFSRDQRFVVTAADHRCAISFSHRDESIRGNDRWICAGGIVTQRLRREPVLAVGAVEIATQHAKSQRI
jgi:hypothetical protein